jgi:hypothetical protein
VMSLILIKEIESQLTAFWSKKWTSLLINNTTSHTSLQMLRRSKVPFMDQIKLSQITMVQIQIHSYSLIVKSWLVKVKLLFVPSVKTLF